MKVFAPAIGARGGGKPDLAQGAGGDAAKLAELKPQEQRYWRLVAERKGAVDERMQEFRWLLEELRVSFFERKESDLKNLTFRICSFG